MVIWLPGYARWRKLSMVSGCNGVGVSVGEGVAVGIAGGCVGAPTSTLVGVAVEVLVGSDTAAGFGAVVLVATEPAGDSRVSVGSGANWAACLPPQAVTDNSADANISRLTLVTKLSKALMMISPAVCHASQAEVVSHLDVSGQ